MRTLRFSVASHDECLRLLATVPVGHVGLNMGGEPVVLPVNFALLDGDIVFRTVEGTKFLAAVAGNVVAFEADSYEPHGRSGWSVLVQGQPHIVTDPTEVSRVHELIAEPWAVEPIADRVIRISSAKVSGRRFERS